MLTTCPLSFTLLVGAVVIEAPCCSVTVATGSPEPPGAEKVRLTGAAGKDGSCELLMRLTPNCVPVVFATSSVRMGSTLAPERKSTPADPLMEKLAKPPWENPTSGKTSGVAPPGKLCAAAAASSATGDTTTGGEVERTPFADAIGRERACEREAALGHAFGTVEEAREADAPAVPLI
jgi:hypothetical protein